MPSSLVIVAVSYTHLRAHETLRYLVCRLLLEKKINQLPQSILEIIFFESNIAILWDEKLGLSELKKIHHSINKI